MKLKWLLTIILVLGVSFAACEKEIAVEKSISPFQDIMGSDVHDYGTYQVKITYVSKQTNPIPTLAFSSSYYPDMSAFKLYYRDGIHYGNDDIAVWSFLATPEEIKSFVDSIAPFPALTSTDTIPNPKLSFMIMRDTGTDEEKCFEALVGDADSYDLLYTLRASLDPSNGLGGALVDQLSQVLQVSP